MSHESRSKTNDSENYNKEKTGKPDVYEGSSGEPSGEKLTETKELFELVRRRTLLRKQYSTDPSNIWLKSQIGTIDDKIHKIDPGFELEEPTIDWASTIFDKGRKLKSHMAKNAGAYLLLAVVISAGGLAVVANYMGRKINEYKAEQAAFSQNISLFDKRLDSTDKKAGKYEKKFREATARLDATHDLFISEVYSIITPLNEKINGLETKIAKSSLEQYELYDTMSAEFREEIAILEKGIEEVSALSMQLKAQADAMSSDKDSQYSEICSKLDALNNALNVKVSELEGNLEDYKEKTGKELAAGRELAGNLSALKGSIGETRAEYQKSVDALEKRIKQLEERKAGYSQ
ncbi:hypothetical protein HYT92_03355 [Candidatus Pacearchaeota archaeon]|nr:hypothetical protein [Candidatus Pacearchaeota archaeon]